MHRSTRSDPTDGHITRLIFFEVKPYQCLHLHSANFQHLYVHDNNTPVADYNMIVCIYNAHTPLLKMAVAMLLIQGE